MEFWCRFGGVLGGDDDKEELLEDGDLGGVVAGLVIEKRGRRNKVRVLSSDGLL